MRRIPLWNQTQEAIAAAVEIRQHDTLMFVTRARGPYYKVSTSASGKVSRRDSVGEQFNKLLVANDLKRPGLGFYALRHTFETIAARLSTSTPSVQSWATLTRTTWPRTTSKRFQTNDCEMLCHTSKRG